VVGLKGGPEETLVPAAGVRLETVRLRGWNRDAPRRNLALPWLLPAALARGVAIVGRFAPDVVLGVGGYVMAPGLAGAIAHRVPYVLQVSEASGLANRIFRAGARAAALTFAEDGERFATAKTVLTGYPLRPGFRPRVPRVPPQHLLVMGGSQGARKLNQTVWSALPRLLERFAQITHLTGAQGQEESARYRFPGYRALPFTGEVASLMADADLVLCRSGVGTYAEVTAVGLPSIVVPGPFGGAHQERTAAQLVAAGAALRIADVEFGPDRLLTEIESLTPDRLAAMARSARALGRPQAAASVARLLLAVAR